MYLHACLQKALRAPPSPYLHLLWGSVGCSPSSPPSSAWDPGSQQKQMAPLISFYTTYYSCRLTREVPYILKTPDSEKEKTFAPSPQITWQSCVPKSKIKPSGHHCCRHPTHKCKTPGGIGHSCPAPSTKGRDSSASAGGPKGEGVQSSRGSRRHAIREPWGLGTGLPDLQREAIGLGQRHWFCKFNLGCRGCSSLR